MSLKFPISLVGKRGFSPASIAGLDLWLDASDNSTVLDATDTAASDGEAVKTWQDKSGNDRHVVQDTAARQPVRLAAEINGLDALDFDGEDWMIGGDWLTQTAAKSIFIVAKTDTTGSFANGGLFQVSDAQGTGRGILITAEVAVRCNTYTWISTSTTTSNQAAVVSVTQSGSGNVHDIFSMWLDGASVTRTSGTNGAIADAAGNVIIGKNDDNDSASSELDGKLCEIIVYDSELSAADREAVENYLGEKWGVTITGGN